MSDKNPCPICGDDSEFLRFLDLCAERANEKWRENEVKTLTDMYKLMGFVQVVRCRDCTGLVETWNGWECERFSGEYHSAEPDGFCAWGERRSDD